MEVPILSVCLVFVALVVPAEMTMSPQLHARRTELERAKVGM